jgi:hypothetical protein
MWRAAAGVLDTGDERGGDRAEPDEKDAEPASGGGDGVRLRGDEVFGFQDDPFLPGERHQWPVPLRRDSAGVGPMFDGALASTEELGEGALAAEAADDVLRWGGSRAHNCRLTEFSLECEEVIYTRG